MGVISDMVDTSIINRYGDKARSFGVSPSLLITRSSDDGINVLSMVKEVTTKEEFDNLARAELIRDRKADFFHFPLVMGQYFGVYNMQDYTFVAQDVRETLNQVSPNFNKTQAFFEEHNQEIYEYISGTYALSYEDYVRIANKMFIVSDRYDFENRDIYKDIGKILIGNDLHKVDNNSDEFMGCREAIEYFNEKNEKQIKFTK